MLFIVCLTFMSAVAFPSKGDLKCYYEQTTCYSWSTVSDEIVNIGEDSLVDMQAVTTLFVINENMERIPENLSEYFPNLETIRIVNSNLQRVDNLEQFKNLKKFESAHNPLTMLTKNSFNNPSLEEVILFEDSILYIEPGTFRNIQKVEFFCKGECGVFENFSLLENTFN